MALEPVAGSSSRYGNIGSNARASSKKPAPAWHGLFLVCRSWRSWHEGGRGMSALLHHRLFHRHFSPVPPVSSRFVLVHIHSIERKRPGQEETARICVIEYRGEEKRKISPPEVQSSKREG